MNKGQSSKTKHQDDIILKNIKTTTY
jgi:hypothetical protein